MAELAMLLGWKSSWLFKSLHTLYGRHHNHNQSEPLPVDHEYSWRKARWAPQA